MKPFFFSVVQQTNNTFMHKALLMTWTEKDSWSGPSNDGCSIHKSEEDFKKFVDDFWKDKPDQVPECYSKQDGGSSHLREIVISDKLYKKLNSSKSNGIRLWESEFEDLKKKNKILFKN